MALENSAAKEHFKLVFGSGNSDLGQLGPLKICDNGDAGNGTGNSDTWFLEQATHVIPAIYTVWSIAGRQAEQKTTLTPAVSFD